MSSGTNISIIQLIKAGLISLDVQISNVRAQKDININIRTFLSNSEQYNNLKAEIYKTELELFNNADPNLMIYLDNKLKNLQTVEMNFISNTLFLAETLSRIEPRTDKLKRAIELFEAAKISEADTVLNESDLLNDQFNLIAFVEYQEKLIQNTGNDS